MKGQPLKDYIDRKGKLVCCKTCGKLFFKGDSSSQQFCSRPCYLIDHGKGVIEFKCLACGASFRTGNKNAKCCSRECYLIYHLDCHPLNLITLCNSCNSRANVRRDRWKKFYKNIVEDKNSSAEAVNG